MRKEIKRFTKAEKRELSNFLSDWVKFSGAYFWTPPSNAAGRRKYEKDNSVEIIFNYKGVEYELAIDIQCSCKNIYVSKGVYLDGKKKNITALKKLMKSIGMEV